MGVYCFAYCWATVLDFTSGDKGMTKTEQIQAIKQSIMDKGHSSTEAVNIICELLHRDVKTIYSYLDPDRADIPDNALELLRLKVGAIP